jgi:Tfp pilus assembly major pilin PilA
MQMHKQRGATLIGMVIIVGILGVGLYAGIRLVPIYLEYMKVSRAMTQTASEAKGGGGDVNAVKSSLSRRWDVEDISTIASKDVEVKKSGNGLTMRANYRAEAPFIANVSLVVDFDKTVEISNRGSE